MGNPAPVVRLGLRLLHSRSRPHRPARALHPPTPTPPNPLRQTIQQTGETLRLLRSDRNLGLAFAASAFFALLFLDSGFWQPLLIDLELPLAGIGYVSAVAAAVGMAISLLIPALHRHDFRHLLTAGIVAKMIILVLLPLLYGPRYLIVSAMFIGVEATATFEGPLRLPSHLRATAVSVKSMIFKLIMGVGGLALGALADHTTLRTVFPVVALFGIGATWAVLRLDRPTATDDPDTSQPGDTASEPRKASHDVNSFYANYDIHPDHRIHLFQAAAELVTPSVVLYPGSYVDIAPSVVFDDARYVDTDTNVAQFFKQHDAVRRLVESKRATFGTTTESFSIRFHHKDYRRSLDIDDNSVDLLISLYAGFISEHCTRYLAPGGHLLVNNSHGDASMATTNPAYRLAGAINSRSGTYRPSTAKLDTYLIPKRGEPPTIDELHTIKRGIAYTKSPYSYLFQKTSA